MREIGCRRSSLQATFQGTAPGLRGLHGERALPDPGRADLVSTSCSACSTRATSIR
jgi:hypothetical protein